MQKIDVHTHILPPSLPKFKEKFGYGGFIQLETMSSCQARMVKDNGDFFREIESNCWDPEVRIKECEKSQVTIQVLSTVPVMFSYWAQPKDALEVCILLNNHIAEVVQKNPKRFIGLGTLPLQSPKLAAGELKRCMEELKLAGVQIGTHVQNKNLNDPELFPVFQEAAKLNAALFIHPWDMMGEERMPQYLLPWLVGMPAEISLAICSLVFGGVFERLPILRVAFAHGGGAFPGTYGRIQHGFNARPDLCAKDNPYSPEKYIGKFFVDSLVHDAEILKYCMKFFGEEKILLGSDYPFPLSEATPGKLIESISEISQQTREKIFWKNAWNWLGIKPWNV